MTPLETVITDGRIVEQTVDNGDGTGTRTTYDSDGNVTATEQLTGLPVVVVPLPTDPLLDATDPRNTTKLRRT
jgi:YD repeat-containing protein